MVPEGLVLLTTLAFALGRHSTGSAAGAGPGAGGHRRTGPGRCAVHRQDRDADRAGYGDRHDRDARGHLGARRPSGALVASDPSPNATIQALATLPVPADVAAPRHGSHSPRPGKWSAVAVLGARHLGARGARRRGRGRSSPGLALGSDRDLRARGGRVLLVARSHEPLGRRSPPRRPRAGRAWWSSKSGSVPRPDATIGYLARQGVEIKVLSGDDPRTVASVAETGRHPGISGRQSTRRNCPTIRGALAQVVEASSIFGRVQPHQKKAVVSALQSRGHVVAMTGDGVNDVPALKQADLGLAMGSGSQATRAVGRIVLLDSSFAAVPGILGEGRRVIANIERVANLFVTKTVYAAILAVVVGISAIPFPFYPRHLTIVSTLTIGVPGFFLALSSGAPRCPSGIRPACPRLHRPSGGRCCDGHPLHLSGRPRPRPRDHGRGPDGGDARPRGDRPRRSGVGRPAIERGAGCSRRVHGRWSCPHMGAAALAADLQSRIATGGRTLGYGRHRHGRRTPSVGSRRHRSPTRGASSASDVGKTGTEPGRTALGVRLPKRRGSDPPSAAHRRLGLSALSHRGVLWDREP